MRCAFLCLITSAVLGGSAAAQVAEPLFVVRNQAAAATTQETVGIRIDHLFADTTGRVLLNIRDHPWVATLERVDDDGHGHRVWVGHIEGVEYSHVSFAERNGYVSALINGLSDVYEVRTLSPGTYALQSVPPAEHYSELQPLVNQLNAANDVDGRHGVSRVIAHDDRSTIDVLLLYTPGAIARVGGPAQMQALVAQIISDSNTIFGRSGITTRLRLVGAQEIPFSESTSMSVDLETLTNSPGIRALRDEFKADVVQVLEEAAQAGACGVAWQLTSLAETNFDAYSIADVDCVSQYTPTHEMGHNMGSHHAPEDDATFALFPYSFGYKDPVRGFRTVMAYSCLEANCPRIPNMSNPSVLHNGAPTGTSTQNNALSVNNAAETVANFRRQTATPPSAPTGLSAAVSANAVTLSWNRVANDVPSRFDAATSYTLQVGSAPGLSNLLSLNVGNTTSVTGMAPDGTYFWRVLAANSGGFSPPSVESTFTVGTCVVPSTPQNFFATTAGPVVTLTWAAPTAGTGPFTYVLEAGSTTGASNLFNGNIGGLTSLSVQAPPGVYYVRIRAQNGCGLGPPSSERVVIVP